MGRPRKRHRPHEDLEQLPEEDSAAPNNGHQLPMVFDSQAVSSFLDTDPPNAADLLTNSNCSQAHNTSIYQSQHPSSSNQSYIQRSPWSNDNPNALSIEDTPPSDSLPTPPTFSIMPDPAIPDLNNLVDTRAWYSDYDGFNMPTVLDTPALASNRMVTQSASLEQTCACLSNLYLTLSSLSTLQASSAVPGQPSPNTLSDSLLVTPATISSLRMASREAYRVIYCSICPKSFQTGMQNLMLLCTLLSVLGDIWGRLFRAPIENIRGGFAAGTPNADSVSDADWRGLTRRLVRRGVYGGTENSNVWHYLETEDEQCDKWYSLAYLMNSLERRQKTWHGQLQDDGEFPGKKHADTNAVDSRVKFGSILSPNIETVGGQTLVRDNAPRQSPEKGTAIERKGCKMQRQAEEEEGHMCLKIISQVRGVMAALQLEDESLQG